MNSPRLFSLSPLAMAITLALFPYLAQGNQNDAENRQDAVAKLAHLPEAQAQPHQWQDTDHNHINQDKLTTLRAMLVDTGVDLHTFEKDEIYPESIVAHGFSFYDSVSHHISTQLSPDMIDDGPEMHGTKMARVLLNTAGGGSIYPVQGLVRKRGEPVPHWRNRLLAMGVANERSIAQTGRAAPVVANIWVEGISEYAQPEYIEKLAHIAKQGSLLLFANGNEPLDPAIPNEPYSSVSRMLAPNSEQLDERLKDNVIAITAITKGKQKYQPCGKAKNFCLAANADTPINYFDPILKQWIYADIPNGTSSATAYASGVALAIAQKYDWFKAKDIRNTLFTTANDKGETGIDVVYGVGEINKQKALNGYGRFDAQNNNVLDVNGIAERYYFDNDIGGDGGFTKRGDKELVLNGNNRFQGKGVIEQGKLTINGTNTAQFEIKQGATLATGTSPNKISTGSLYNSGRLEVINPSPLYIEGDFTNTETGEINTAIGSSINVSGQAILNGVMRVSQITQGYVPQSGRREVLLRANELVDNGIRLHLDSALVNIADTIAFDQNKKQIYVGLQRKNISEALDDLTHTITPPSPPTDTVITNKEKTDTTVSAHSESAVINLADLPEAEKNYFPNWTDTDRYPTTSSSHKPAIAMLVDTGVDPRTFKEGELYPESVAAKPNQTPSFEVQHYFKPDVNDHSFHGSKMGRILLNTAGMGQLYITQGVRAPNSSWRSILSASYAANQRLQQQTQKAAPVIGNIWKDFIEIQNYQEYVNQVQNIKEQGSLQLFATGNESSEYHSEAGTQPGRTIIALIDNNTGDLLTSLKDTIIAVTGVKSNGQKVFRPCGKAKNFCITSNVDTQISYFNPDKGYREISRPGGTSSATAYASGVALAVKQKYDWFEAKDIRNTLFTTAIDKGTPGIDETWGVGVINKSQALMGYGRFDSQNDNRLTVNGIAERYYFNNDIEGDGGFTKLGEKELVFNGNNSFKGDGIIEQGKLTLNGSNQANFIVKQGGTLASGTLVKLSSKDQKAQPITSGSVNNFGIIESLNQTDWNINGNLINNATGVINKAIGSTINVSGIANLGGIMNVDQIAPYYVPQNGRREVLLRANGLVNNGIQLNLNPALIDVANTIVFDENKKEIYVGLQRKSVQQALEDQDTSNGHSPETPVINDKVTPPTEETASTVETDNTTESASNGHSEETPTTEEITVPPTTETASTVETDNTTESVSTEHSEEASTTEETTVPATTETASTVETGNATESESTEHSEETSTTEETTVPATTETASTVETGNATESESNGHSEETSTTEETTVPATTETASTVETDNTTESASTGHSEETSTTEETTVPATTETASTVETDNTTESASTGHSEEASSINKKNKAQRAYLGAMEDARLLDRVLEKLDQGYASQQLNTQQKQWANRLFNTDRTHFTEYLFSQGIQSLIHQQQSWVNHEAFQRLNWIASFSQKNHTALWISGENRSASPDVSHINTTDHFNSVAINGLLVEGKHRFSFSISEQRQKYEEHYKEVEKSFNERDVAFRLGYGYEFIPNWTLLTSFNYGVGKLKYQQQFNTQNTHSQGNTQSYASTLGIHWSQPINAQWIWHNIANIDYTHKQLTHLMLNDDVKINRLVTEQTNIGVISELEYKLKNLTLFGRLALQKTLHNKNRGRVSYATTSVDIEQSYRLYPDWKPLFGIGMGYQYHNWRFSLSGDMAKDHYHRVNVSVGYSF
ncbi:S8 family serine peptidase [Avibacterium sp. 20-15]|uniref:S8 family serine peptidase n=1 Tax=unclassified Avibacterium TaxID=2685287 RepID=UPI0020272F31|nr:MULTISPECIES: S8 family serine peptidase [unclassified Avibacterium]MCW9733670.1 S8 family serine peptidase [Avibacterium sp. 20-15]URL03524.1 S8 family serine peptidase [Avibacterium sp. 20-132]